MKMSKWKWTMFSIAYGLPNYEQMIWLEQKYPDTPIRNIPLGWKWDYEEEVLLG